MNDIDQLHMRWEKLCVALGRDAVTAQEACTALAEQHGGRLGEALTALGFPDAWRTPAALGAALRVLSSRAGTDGAMVARVRRRAGGRWYVRRAVATGA